VIFSDKWRLFFNAIWRPKDLWPKCRRMHKLLKVLKEIALNECIALFSSSEALAFRRCSRTYSSQKCH
jgi:hypothetical protein